MISILMPVFNEENHLVECLDSILQQSFQDWELLAVDDFSTDNSFMILEEYAAKDARVKPFRNKEKGIIPALELAYAQSQGDTLTRMDADDKMPANKLDSMYHHLQQHPQACITAKVSYFSKNELADGFLRYADWLNAMVDQKNHYAEIYKECVVASPCWMMKKDVLKHIGGISSGRYPEDYDMVFRLYEHDVEIHGVDEVLHFWRDHAERASRNDPHYMSQDFVDLKLHFLEKLEFSSVTKINLWGAGRAGKLWAKALKNKGINFTWFTDNPKKIGKDIYDQRLFSSKELANSNEELILIAIKATDFYDNNADFLNLLKKRNKLISLY